MSETYHHGVRVFESLGGGRTMRIPATSIIGVVCTATDADNTVFPLNKPVLVNDIQSVIGKAGVQGTLKKTLEAIDNQTKTFVVVVRVEHSDVPATMDANIIGTTDANGETSGLKSLLTAQSKIGVKPKILGAPGLDSPAVAAALGVTAVKLGAFVYVFAHGCNTKEEAQAYRDQFGQREIMVIWPDAAVGSQTISSIATALGARAQIDLTIGWHKTISNIVLPGLTGTSKPVHWDLQDSSSDANFLNANEVTTLVAHQGIRFWGSRTCSSDPLFAFENYTRTAQVLKEMIAEAHLPFVDMPMTPQLAKDIIDGVNAKIRELVTAGKLIGGLCWLIAERNTASSLIAGKLWINYKYTPVPPLEDLSFQQEITDEFLIDFAARVTG